MTAMLIPAVFTLAALFCPAQETAEKVMVKAALAPPVTPFHRPAEYRITVEAPAKLRLQIPELKSDDFENIAVKADGEKDLPAEKGRIRRRYTWELDPVGPGAVRIAPDPVRWEGGTAPIPALQLVVRELTDAEKAAVSRFAGIAPPAEAVPLPGRWEWLGWLLAAAGGFLLAMAGWRLWRRLHPPAVAPPPAPWEVALRRLRELNARQLPAKGRFDLFYVDLSAILRYYIEDRFSLHAPEQTTPEFLEAAARSGRISREHQDFLAGFLRECDRIKFAKHHSSETRMREDFSGVWHFVEATMAVVEETPETAKAQAGGHRE
jgi:hypothetical protein